VQELQRLDRLPSSSRMMLGFIRDSRRTLGSATIEEPIWKYKTKNKATGNIQTSSQIPHLILGIQSS